jgi:hypothetical protein
MNEVESRSEVYLITNERFLDPKTEYYLHQPSSRGESVGENCFQMSFRILYLPTYTFDGWVFLSRLFAVFLPVYYYCYGDHVG